MPGSNALEKLVDAFKVCDAISFPNIKVRLNLALTLPITTCEYERSFSQLQLIKNFNHFTTFASQISGFSLMKINRDSSDEILKSEREIKRLASQFSADVPFQP